MIISHRQRFIFLKTTKAAGSSIEIALSEFCGEDDILTGLDAREEELRLGRGGCTAQHYNLAYEDHCFVDRLRIRFRQKDLLFYDHARAKDLRPYVSPDQWKGYFKFAVARNPWDRVVSQFYFTRRKNPDLTFDEYFTPRRLRRINRRGWGLYTIHNRPVVDKVCRFENLDEDMEEVRLAIGLPKPLDLPFAKSDFRKEKGCYKDYYDEKRKNLVARIFHREIALMGYQF